MSTRSRAACVFTVLVLTCALTGFPVAQGTKTYTIVFHGGTVVDGSGALRFRADVAVQGDRIARVERAGIAQGEAVTDIDASGLIIAPGFIDSHAHVATTIHEYPLAENFLRQGITTIVASLHSLASPWPIDVYATSLKMAPNISFFVGHTWIRKEVLGLENRAPTAAELERMKSLVEDGMKLGAIGLSTGLEYVPANYADTEEIIELAKVAARYGGIYVTHLRDEGPGLVKAVEETIRIAREAKIPAQINHHKAAGAAQFGWSRRTLALIDQARASGLDITHDLYPYTAFSTTSEVLFPAWCLAGGPQDFAKRITDPASRAKIEREMLTIFPQQAGRGPASIQFRELDSSPKYNGRTLADYLRDRKHPVTVSAGVRALIELQLAGGFIAIFHSMDEADVVRILRHPWAMIETDGDLVGFGVGHPHPRSYGSFPRVLTRYVREQKVLTLEDAIRKMTSLPAAQIGHSERGMVKEGKIADLVVFDSEKIQDLATYTDPHRYPAGIVHLVVNGMPVILNGALTGEKPGRVLNNARTIKQ